MIKRWRRYSPEQRDSVGWVSSHKVKGYWLDSQSGHVTGLQVQFPVRVHMRGNQLMFLSHVDVSLPLFIPSFPSLWKQIIFSKVLIHLKYIKQCPAYSRCSVKETVTSLLLVGFCSPWKLHEHMQVPRWTWGLSISWHFIGFSHKS